MSLSTILLALFVLLQAIAYLGWYNATALVLGVVGLAYVIVLVLEVFGVLSVNIPVHRTRP